MNNGHPDANILAAFSEHTLRGRERAEVVAHLAICKQCRDCVAVASSAKPVQNQPNIVQIAVWRSAAVAAGLAGVLLLILPFMTHITPPARLPGPTEIQHRAVRPTASLISLVAQERPSFAAQPPRWSVEIPRQPWSKAPGRIYKSIDGGNTWQPVALDPRVNFESVTSNGRRVWAGGPNGTVFYSPDEGAHWIQVPAASRQNRR